MSYKKITAFLVLFLMLGSSLMFFFQKNKNSNPWEQKKSEKLVEAKIEPPNSWEQKKSEKLVETKTKSPKPDKQKTLNFFLKKKFKTAKPDKQKRSLVLGKLTFVPSINETTLKKHVENQWALKDISILQAWKQTKGKKNIVVAVIDTGVHLLHPCLKSNLWMNPKEIPNNKIDDDKNGFVDDIHGWNFSDNNNNLQDRHGHGTHIAGLIAATGATSSNPNCKVIGVAPKVSLMVLKYYDSNNDGNNVSNTIKSIEYAINNGAHIINYSGGGPGANEKEKTLIAKAADKNIYFCFCLRE